MSSKRFISGLVVSALAVAALVAPATAKVGGQKEEGTILLPSPSPNAGEGCWQGWPRRFYMFSQGATSGPFGSVIEIDPKTWNGKFKLEVAGGATGAEDIDIHFFVDLGTLDPVNDPAQQTTQQSQSYQTREAGGETGLVAPETKHAIICLVPGTGFETDWTYKAAPPKKAKKP